MTHQEQIVVKERAYTLTTEEKNILGNELLGLLNDEDDLAREKKALAAELKGREELLNIKITRLREKASTGIEMRKYKCYVLRNAQTHTVDTVYAEDYGPGKEKGQIFEQRKWGPEEFDAHFNESQLGIPFDSAGNPNAPDENDLRAQADLTATPEVQPDMENGQVIAGHNTDAYNMAHPGSPYQHLSELTDFAPAIVPPAGEQGQDEAAEPTDAADVDREDHGQHRKLPADDDEADESTDDEPSEDDDPQPKKPKVPTRPANRRK